MKMQMLVVLGVCALLASCGGREAAEEEAQEQAVGDQAEAERREQPSANTGDADSDADDDDDDAERDRVEVSAEVQERLGISVAEVREESLAISLAVAGSVQPIESRVARVRPLARGRVLEVRARIGDRVERGAELARFDNVEAGELAAERDAAVAQLASLRAHLATVTRQAERTARLVEIGAVPQREHDANVGEQQQIEASIRAQESTIAGMEARLRRFETAGAAADQTSIAIVRSPLSGIVIRVAAAPGDVVDSSSELFAVADISRVYVQAQVFEKDLGMVREGSQARVGVDAYPDERFSGQVAVVGGVVDPRSRTVPVRVEVANPNSLLKLDMFARVELATDAQQPGLAIPAEAAQTLDGRQVVFVKVEETEFAVRPVETGRSDGNLIEITQGLEAGESVVTGGAFKVKSALLAGELGDDDDDAQE
ncbi:MAG: efflux RND transporter periplasmic adaptor subunit [Vicinamibacterales bacterium]